MVRLFLLKFGFCKRRTKEVNGTVYGHRMQLGYWGFNGVVKEGFDVLIFELGWIAVDARGLV